MEAFQFLSAQALPSLRTPKEGRTSGALVINTLHAARFFPLHWSFNLFVIPLPKTEVSPPGVAGDMCKCTNTHAYNLEHHLKKFTDSLNGPYEPQAENPSLTAKLSDFNSNKFIEH